VDKKSTFGEWWHISDNIEIPTSLNVSNGFIIMCISSSDGFVFCDSISLCLKQTLQRGEYYGQMNSDNFEKQMKEKVILNWL
jgi:hypothetical protein